jgi:predicted ATPase
MLKRIYIDNYKCLVNFEIQLDPMNLFLGGNGTGKSTVMDALRVLQAFISGEGKTDQLFFFFLG